MWLIADGFLSNKDAREIMEVKKMTSLYSLQDCFCTVHGVKLDKDSSKPAHDTAGTYPSLEMLALQGKVNLLLPPLQAGEYDTILPVTVNDGLRIHCYSLPLLTLL